MRQFWENAIKPYYLYYLCSLIIISIYLIIIILFHPHIVHGQSMYPTFHEGDLLKCTNEITAKTIHRGDVVVFKKDGCNYIKRVIGVPGDKLFVKDGQIMIKNGIIFVFTGYEYDEIKDSGIIPKYNKDNLEVLVLGENDYFCVGDNRNNSYDCREFGPILLNEIDYKFDKVLCRFKK